MDKRKLDGPSCLPVADGIDGFASRQNTGSVNSRIVRDTDELVDLACRILPTMQNEDGLFCFEGRRNDTTRHGQSVRYSIIVLLGLLRFRGVGGSSPIDVFSLHAAIHRHRTTLGLGDTALLLWADARLASDRATETIEQLTRLIAVGNSESIDQLEGMEIAWWTIGALEAQSAGMDAKPLLDHAVHQLCRRKSQKSALFRHLGHGRRAALPNFATEIYSLLALAMLAKRDYCEWAESWAIQLADFLLESQCVDGGWPWLFHSERSLVVEPYELYSVHQDAMAPMAMFELAEATGSTRYVRAALDGLDWCYGNNELRHHLVDQDDAFIDRSIRRSGKGRWICLAGNTILSSTTASNRHLDLGTREVNTTMRPYHIGWILEAWSGREQLVQAAHEGAE